MTVAIKLERAQEDNKRTALRIEAIVLKKLQTHSSVPHYYEFGHDSTYHVNYLCMQLLGPNLMHLRKRTPAGRFSCGTVLHVGLQALDILAGMHELGFLHRDMKPSNLVTGLRTSNKAHRKVYIIDFGLSRYYAQRQPKTATTPSTREGEKQIKKEIVPQPARTNVQGFRGTPRYASPHVHATLDLGRRDDLWSLFYMLIEMAAGHLPWAGLGDRQEIARLKHKYDSPELLPALLMGCPRALTPLCEHLHRLKFESKPDYAYLRGIFESELVERATPDPKQPQPLQAQQPLTQIPQNPIPPSIPNTTNKSNKILKNLKSETTSPSRSTVGVKDRESQGAIPVTEDNSTSGGAVGDEKPAIVKPGNTHDLTTSEQTQPNPSDPSERARRLALVSQTQAPTTMLISTPEAIGSSSGTTTTVVDNSHASSEPPLSQSISPSSSFSFPPTQPPLHTPASAAASRTPGRVCLPSPGNPVKQELPRLSSSNPPSIPSGEGLNNNINNNSNSHNNTTPTRPIGTEMPTGTTDPDHNLGKTDHTHRPASARSEESSSLIKQTQLPDSLGAAATFTAHFGVLAGQITVWEPGAAADDDDTDHTDDTDNTGGTTTSGSDDPNNPDNPLISSDNLFIGGFDSPGASQLAHHVQPQSQSQSRDRTDCSDRDLTSPNVPKLSSYLQTKHVDHVGVSSSPTPGQPELADPNNIKSHFVSSSSPSPNYTDTTRHVSTRDLSFSSPVQDTKRLSLSPRGSPIRSPHPPRGNGGKRYVKPNFRRASVNVRTSPQTSQTSQISQISHSPRVITCKTPEQAASITSRHNSINTSINNKSTGIGESQGPEDSDSREHSNHYSSMAVATTSVTSSSSQTFSSPASSNDTTATAATQPP